MGLFWTGLGESSLFSFVGRKQPPWFKEELRNNINFSIAQILLTLGGIIFHASIAPNSDPSKAIKG